MLLSETLATNPLHKADGSGLWTNGPTKVLVSINGPIEVPRRDELIQETTIDIQFRPVSGFASPHEKILELQLREFVESIILRTLNPRSLVQIVVQVLSIDTEAVNSIPAVLTSTLNAMMLALLATPSIPLRTSVSAIEVVKAQGVVICHPTEQQRRQATSTHVICIDNNSNAIIFYESWGDFTIEEWEQVIDEGIKERKSVEHLLREQVSKLVGISSTS